MFGCPSIGTVVLIGAIAVSSGAAPLERGDVLHLPQQYPTIQEAIEACPNGGTIQLAPGEYREALISIDPEDLRILGSPSNPATTTIYSDIEKRNALFGFGRDPRRITLEGLTIAESTNHGVLVSSQVDLRIVDCIIRDCAGAGVMLQTNANGTFRRTSFLRNGDCGVFVYVRASMDAEDCDFIDNVTPCYGGGIGLAKDASCQVRSCRFEGNFAFHGGAIGLADGSWGSLNDCRFVSNMALEAPAWWGDKKAERPARTASSAGMPQRTSREVSSTRGTTSSFPTDAPSPAPAISMPIR